MKNEQKVTKPYHRISDKIDLKQSFELDLKGFEGDSLWKHSFIE
jgi:hypothetical protein